MASAVDGAVTLPGLVVNGIIERPCAFVGEVTLPSLSVSGRVGEANTLVGRLVLPLGFRPNGRVRWNAAIYVLTGPARANGCTVFCFVGPPDRVVEWRVLSGSGLLTPYQEYTDTWGRASCKYEANGYSGQLTIEVRYGA